MHDITHINDVPFRFKYHATKTYASGDILNLALDAGHYLASRSDPLHHLFALHTHRIWQKLSSRTALKPIKKKKSVHESNPGHPVRCLTELSRLLIHMWVNKTITECSGFIYEHFSEKIVVTATTIYRWCRSKYETSNLQGSVWAQLPAIKTKFGFLNYFTKFWSERICSYECNKKDSHLTSSSNPSHYCMSHSHTRVHHVQENVFFAHGSLLSHINTTT